MMNADDKVYLLIVDDRPENLLALEAVIEQEDYVIMKASSGEEALKQLLKHDFAAVLLDVQMPGMDGFAAAKIIKARERTKNTPILFITANNLESEHIFTGYSVGASDYILKPVDPFILKSKVESYADLYRMKRKLVKQAALLAEKSNELEKMNKELMLTAAKLRDSEALANVISLTSMDSMIVVNQEGLIIKTNPAVQGMFGCDPEQLLGQPIDLLFTEENARRTIRRLLQNSLYYDAFDASEAVQEVSAARLDGSQFPAEIQAGKGFFQKETILALTLRDITKKKQAQQMIAHMAYYDALTNLPNRRMFHERLTEWIHQAKNSNQPLAVLYLDMDRFKSINDSLGHLIGDLMLQAIALRIMENLREGDLAARIGGDEFNVLLPGTSRERALDIASQIVTAFKKPFHIDNYELYISTSIGISVFPYDGEDSISLLKNTDAALYRAKEQGKNKYTVYHTGMNIQTYRSFVLQNDLRKAIDRDELFLVYQPRLDVCTGQITSAEVLLRWNHPSWGLIMPSDIIPLAEETGFMMELGQWALETVCKQSRAWKEHGYPSVRLAVNFSIQNLMSKDLAERLTDLMHRYEVLPSALEIEITESIIVDDHSQITQLINQLRLQGVTISIDDFGKGYSSLNSIRQVPADILKIDKSFIHDLSAASTESTALLSTIIMLARSLKLQVIAEGVETEEQLQLLKQLGCDMIQGCLFSRPVPSDQFERLLVNEPGKPPAVTHPASAPSRSALLTQIEHNELNADILSSALKRTKKNYALSSREYDVFELIVDGLSNKEISEKLFISEHTVKNHVTHIFQKLSVSDRMQALAKVYQTCIEEAGSMKAQ